MIGTIHTDNEDELRVVARPVRKTKPTAALLQHSERAALPSQMKAIKDFRAAEAAKLAAECQLVDENEISAAPSSQCSPDTTTMTASTPAPDNSKRARVEDVVDTDIENDDDERENARTNPKCEFFGYYQCIYFTHSKAAKRVRRATVADQEDVDEDGILADVDVQPITDPGPLREDKTRDLDRFFGKPFERTGTNGTVKKHRKCTVCP